MTQEELLKLSQEAEVAARETIKNGMIESLKRQTVYSLDETVRKITQEFMDKEIAPALKAHLMSEKSAIISAGIQASNEMGEQLAKILKEKLLENLKNSWQAGRVLDALFK